MNPSRLTWFILACGGALCAGSNFAVAAEFQYMRAGNAQDAPAAAPKAGFALMGGGNDLDQAFRWLCELGVFYTLSVHKGKLHSTQAGGACTDRRRVQGIPGLVFW